MDITNKAVKVSERMQEIEYRLSCGDMTVRDADDLRYEYAELQEWNELLNAYFDVRNKAEKLLAENEALRAENARLCKNLVKKDKDHAKKRLTKSEERHAKKLEKLLSKGLIKKIDIDFFKHIGFMTYNNLLGNNYQYENVNVINFEMVCKDFTNNPDKFFNFYGLGKTGFARINSFILSQNKE